MRYLLDTHALLWWLFDDPRLPDRVRGLLAEPAHEVLVSSASAWEIATKHRLGRLPEAEVLVTDIAGWVRQAGFGPLPVTIEHTQRAGTFSQPHRDPFDRMLAAQSLIEKVPLVSRDPDLSPFGVDLVW